MLHDVIASYVKENKTLANAVRTLWKAGVPALVATALSAGLGGSAANAQALDQPLPDGVLATAAGYRLTADSAAHLLAANPLIPADAEPVRALAGLWMDYTLLTEAAAEDSTLAAIDLDALTLPMRNDELRVRLLQREVRADTVFTADELSRLWEEHGPGTEVRVRHILLLVPAGATRAQQDSVRRQAEALRRRAADGEDFARLASEFSQEPGAAEREGDLGYFGRGMMVPPFEHAAFRLQPGEISPVTETPFGLHVIKMEDRRTASMAEADVAEFRTFMARRARVEADSLYLDSITRGAGLRIAPGAAAALRDAARRPESVREPAAAGRELAAYGGGRYTVADLAEHFQALAPETQAAVVAAPDADLEDAVRRLATERILLERARALGLALTPAEEDSTRDETRRAIRRVLESSGLSRFAGTRGSQGPARQAAVADLLRRTALGEIQVVPLGVLGSMLRVRYGAEFNEHALPLVIERMDQIRAQEAAIPPEPTRISPD